MATTNNIEKEITDKACDLITIGIPVYNVEKYVERALLSVLNQTYPNLEFIVVDDKGTDRSMDIVERIKKEHPRGSAIKIIDHVINRTQGAGRNTCIDQASGKYIFFMDSDDEIIPDCVEVLHNEITRVGADVVGSSRKHVFNDKVVCVESWKDHVWRGKEEVVRSFFGQISLYNSGNLYDVSFLRKNDIKTDLSTIDDLNFSFKVVLKATTVAMLSKVMYIYYVNEGGVTSGGSWSEKIFKHWNNLFWEEKILLDNAELPAKLKITAKKKLFIQRLIISEAALKSKLNVQHYLRDYLSPIFFDKDIWKSAPLFVFYVYSKMPLGVKKATVPWLMWIKNLRKR